ncbi:hypothetical protein FDECE_3870 [Fusarium decemcellulare]|nr:hypothetical protein FDECE_3870 [Fusarium decemcellulare]
MSSAIQTVMVLGGRGNLGPFIISALSKAGFKVSVLSRISSSSTDTTFMGVSMVKSDYTFESLVSAFTGQDAVISTLPTANIAGQKTIIDAAAAAKVKRFLPSEFGSDTSVDGLEKMAPFLKGKQEVMEYVRTKEAEGLTWTALFTGPWIDWMLLEGHGLLCIDVKSKTTSLVDAGEPRFTTTTIANVAEATAAILLRPNETKDQYVHIGSFNLNQKQIVEVLERLSGTKVSITHLSNAELYARATKHIEDGDWYTGYYELATTAVYSDSEVTFFPHKAAHWNKVLGLGHEESLDDMIFRVLTRLEA